MGEPCRRLLELLDFGFAMYTISGIGGAIFRSYQLQKGQVLEGSHVVEVDELDFGSFRARKHAAMSEKMACQAHGNGMAVACASSVEVAEVGIYISLETVAQKSRSSEHQTTCRSYHAAISPASTWV